MQHVNEQGMLSEEAKKLADQSVIIPIEGMESLNAAAAGAIFLWEIVRRETCNEG